MIQTLLRFTVTAVAALVVGTLAVADVAPSEFIGSGIVPPGASVIRMTSAQVEIVWGSPCEMSAAFEFENDSSSAIDLQLGFPVVSFEDRIGLSATRTSFSVAFEGVTVASNEVTKTKGVYDDSTSTLYHFHYTFPPGRTRAKVTAQLPASLTKGWGGRERLFYCIQTGGGWNGTIGREEVTIHFPAKVESEQIVRAVPSNYCIQGSSVSWSFTDIKPKGNEYDISLEYLRPDVLQLLSDLRKRHSADPSDVALTIKLAKHLFALGRAAGYAGYPPDRLSQVEFDSILHRINDHGDQARFRKRYVRQSDGAYHEFPDSEWTRERREMIRILNGADYQPPYSQSPHVDEARRLMERVLSEEPHNTQAWNVYLANYGQFSFGSVGIWLWGPRQFYYRQINLIKRAHNLCPNDPAIELWFKRSREKSTIDERDDPLWGLLVKEGVFDTDYPKVDYDYY